jgi:plastocyanin
MSRCFIVFIAAALLSAALAFSDEGPRKLPPQNIGGIDAPSSATITGVIRFSGAKPEPKPIEEVLGNAYCKQHYPDGPPLREDLVFGKIGSDDTLENVLVYVSKGLEGMKLDPPTDHVVLDQAGCVYTPHVVAVMVGQTLEIRNSDATLHNVMTMPRENPPFNIGMPVQGGKLERTFAKPEFKMNFKCFMHPWMSAYVHVLPHPFFAVSGADGRFTIKGLPPGEYEISVLHETSMFEATPASATVKLAAGQSKPLDFTFRARAIHN